MITLDMEKTILVLASTFPINKSDSVPSFVKDQIIHFKKLNPGFKFIVLAPSLKNYTPEESTFFDHKRYRYFFSKFEKLTEGGIMPTIKNNFFMIFLIPFFIFSQGIAAIKIAKKFKPFHLYAHWVTPQALTALLIFKLFKIPYSFSSHAHDAEILIKIPLLGKYLLNKIVKNSHSFTFDSKNTELKLKKYIKKNNWDNKKSLVMPLGVNNTMFDETVSKKIGIEKFLTENNITFIGRFAEKKGVEILIKAFSEVIKQGYEANLILCGTGPLKNKYIQLVKKLNIDKRVYILDFFNSPDKLKSVYEFSDIIVIPSIKTKDGDVEGLPIVGLEALYFGKILIASYQSNMGEIIEHMTSGFLFDSSNTLDLVEILISFINKEYDRKIIQKNAKNLSLNYLISDTSKSYFNHLFEY